MYNEETILQKNLRGNSSEILYASLETDDLMVVRQRGWTALTVAKDTLRKV